MNLPTFSEFAKWEAFNNVVGVLMGPFVNYLTKGWLEELDPRIVLVAVNGAPIVLGAIKSLIVANYCSPDERPEAEISEEAAFNTTAALVMHASNTLGILSRNETLLHFNQGPVLLASGVAGMIIKKGFFSAASKHSLMADANSDASGQRLMTDNDSYGSTSSESDSLEAGSALDMNANESGSIFGRFRSCCA